MPGLIRRLADDLAGDLHAFTLTGARANAALRMSLASVLSTLAALALNLENPWWAAITGVVLVQGQLVATLSRSADRVLGTAIGAAVGFLGALTIADHPVFMLIAAASTAFVLYGQERAEHGYAVLLSGITVVIVMFSSLASPEAALQIPIARAIEIVVGVAVTCTVDFALAPPPEARPPAPPKPGIWTPPLDRDLLAIAVTGGIAIGLIPLIWETLQLPGLGQTPVTAVVILTAMRQEPVWKATTRLAGCVLGGAYGLAALPLAGGSLLPWLLLMFVGLYLAGHIAQGGGDAAYVGVQAGIAIVISMIQGAGPTDDVMPAIERLVGVFGGILVVSICHPLLAPLVRRLIGPP